MDELEESALLAVPSTTLWKSVVTRVVEHGGTGARRSLPLNSPMKSAGTQRNWTWKAGCEVKKREDRPQPEVGARWEKKASRAGISPVELTLPSDVT